MGSFFGTLLPVYLTLMAWITSTLFYQLAEGHQLIWIAVPVAMLVLMYGALWITGMFKS